MLGTTAQLVALCCHFNGRARGAAARPFFPANSTCQFCEYIHFARPEARGSGESSSWVVVAQTPEEWLQQEAKPGRSAVIVRARGDDPGISDRMFAGFVGGAGRWLLALTADGTRDLWEASWEVGNQSATDQRIWQVRYGLVAERVELALPQMQTVQALSAQLAKALRAIATFAEERRLDGFAACFRRAIRCLSGDDPFAEVAHKDLAPEGVLDLPAQRLLAACQAAWVFGGMGSWNDLSFDGADQTRYDKVSEKLYTLLNEGICASANASAVRGT
jgi:hypothetical protein